MRIQLIVILLVAVLLILMTVQNPNPVSLQFLSWRTRGIPQIVVILVSLLAGVILATVLGLAKQSKLKQTIRRMQEEIEERKQPSGLDQDRELEE